MTTGTRVRLPEEPSGQIGVRQAARKYAIYGISPSHISNWVKRGEVAVAKAPARKGDPMLLDERSLRHRIGDYTPHRDNGAKRGARGRSLTMPAVEANGHIAAPPQPRNAGGMRGRSLPARATAQAPAAEAQTMDSAEWVAKFSTRKKLSAASLKNYDWTFKPFLLRFSVLPMDRLTLLDYIRGLKVAAGSKARAHVDISTLYNWLRREHGIHTPDLTQPDLPAAPRGGPALTQDQMAAVLRLARSHEEWSIIAILGQTGMRVGELCSLNEKDHRRAAERKRGEPVLHSEGWATVYGKPTRANETGERPVYLPTEAYKALEQELRVHGCLTFKGQPATEIALLSWMRWLLKRAGVYERGMNTHAFRRAFEAEFLRNGGSDLWMDELLGHRKVGMRSLYFNGPPEEAIKQAQQFAPRRFLEIAKESAA